MHDSMALARLTPEMSKSQKVKRRGLLLCSGFAEPQQPRLVRVELESVFRNPLRQYRGMPTVVVAANDRSAFFLREKNLRDYPSIEKSGGFFP